MNNKPVVRTSSSVALAVAVALSQLMVSNIAQADSVHEWGYWDAATAAGPSSGGDAGIGNISVQNFNTAQNNTGKSIPTDQRLVGIDNGQFVTANAADTGGYVGYTLCYYNCNGGSGYYNATTAGTIHFDVTQGPERLDEHSHYVGEVYPWSDGKPYYVQDTNHYNGKLVVTGTYDGAAFNINDSAPDLSTNVTSYYWGDTYGNSYVNSENDNTSFNAYLGSTYNGVANNNSYSTSSIGNNTSNGQYFYGKPVSATQIAEQVRLGQTYNFSGGSFMGSRVAIAVNFQNATWNGTWSSSNDYSHYNNETGYAKAQNGFAAAGNISGSTLASNSVTGAGVAGVGFVTGGKVDATLVGVIKGTDASAAAIIGKTVVTVQQAIGTKTVGDIFSATTGLPCKGGCNLE
ncbi:hypothetical protein [Methylotenera sp.]|uniref:hypothetical protein n=1 Tax=Methylotenera sp. TaxID=2051956 RepID=UPI002488190A|nr:hypothetical protein [Methylotenera sp.]MDI1299394.1 hypothetical protein [Methylotenera sp.]